MLLLGIDIGSSFIKLWVMDLDSGSAVFERSSSTPEFLDTTGPKREIPMQKLISLVKKMINEALSLYAVEGIGLSVQMHGFELFNNRGALNDFVSWQDMRAVGVDGRQDIAASLRSIAGDYLFRRNGVELRNSHSICPLYHLLREKDLYEPCNFAMMGDSLIRHLTGNIVPIHPTVAASSGLYDLEKEDWNHELIALLSLDHICFPKVSMEREASTYYNFNGRLIPIYTAVGDHQAAVLGSGAMDGDVVINIGTGGQISFVDNALSFDDNYETRPFFSGRTLRALTQLYSGRALDVLMKLVLDVGQNVYGLNTEAGPELWEKINDLAQEAEKNLLDRELEINMSFFNPEGGLIGDINTGNLRVANIFLAAYRNMAECYYRALKQLGLETSSLNSIIGAGGVLHKTTLLQRLMAERFGLELKISPGSEDVMLGLLRLGRWHLHINPGIL